MSKKIEQIDKIYMSSGFICSKIREVIDRVNKLQDDIGSLRGQCGFDEPPHIIDPEMKHKDEVKPLRDKNLVDAAAPVDYLNDLREAYKKHTGEDLEDLLTTGKDKPATENTNKCKHHGCHLNELLSVKWWTVGTPGMKITYCPHCSKELPL